MTVDELEEALGRLGAPGIAYSIGQDRDETYCLLFEGRTWHVFYSERGNRNDEQTFEDESAACQELLKHVLSDGAVQSILRS